VLGHGTGTISDDLFEPKPMRLVSSAFER